MITGLLGNLREEALIGDFRHRRLPHITVAMLAGDLRQKVLIAQLFHRRLPHIAVACRADKFLQ